MRILSRMETEYKREKKVSFGLKLGINMGKGEIRKACASSGNNDLRFNGKSRPFTINAHV